VLCGRDAAADATMTNGRVGSTRVACSMYCSTCN
jgi:hypothetical protein